MSNNVGILLQGLGVTSSGGSFLEVVWGFPSPHRRVDPKMKVQLSIEKSNVWTWQSNIGLRKSRLKNSRVLLSLPYRATQLPCPTFLQEHLLPSQMCVTLDTDHILFGVCIFFRIDLLLCNPIDNFLNACYMSDPLLKVLQLLAHWFLKYCKIVIINPILQMIRHA